MLMNAAKKSFQANDLHHEEINLSNGESIKSYVTRTWAFCVCVRRWSPRAPGQTLSVLKSVLSFLTEVQESCFCQNVTTVWIQRRNFNVLLRLLNVIKCTVSMVVMDLSKFKFHKKMLQLINGEWLNTNVCNRVSKSLSDKWCIYLWYNVNTCQHYVGCTNR